jgi:hypothetical protein
VGLVILQNAAGQQATIHRAVHLLQVPPAFKFGLRGARIGACKEEVDDSRQVWTDWLFGPFALTPHFSRFYHSLAEQQIRTTTDHEFVFEFFSF